MLEGSFGLLYEKPYGLSLSIEKGRGWKLRSKTRNYEVDYKLVLKHRLTYAVLVWWGNTNIDTESVKQFKENNSYASCICGNDYGDQPFQ